MRSKTQRGRRVGRRTKLTPTRAQRVCARLREGYVISAACKLSGIAEATFYNWSARGRREPASEFREFLESVQYARDLAEDAALRVIMAAARPRTIRTVREVTTRTGVTIEVSESMVRGDWRAAAWYLERTRPEGYGRRRTIAAEEEPRIKPCIFERVQREVLRSAATARSPLRC